MFSKFILKFVPNIGENVLKWPTYERKKLKMGKKYGVKSKLLKMGK